MQKHYSFLKCSILLVFFLLAQSLLPAKAQVKDILVSGLIRDSASQQAIPGVTVALQGSTKGTISDGNGNFSLKVSKGSALTIGSIGYTSQTVAAKESWLIINLKRNSRLLGDVTVTTSLGIRKEKRSLGFAVQEIKGADVAEEHRDNFINSLQGRIAGATITSTGGAPGASAQIILRGANSLSGNNQPLFVVDGIPFTNNTFNNRNLVSGESSASNDFINRAADINAEDIESISVLKGPEGAALYGIDAASGAILITTKKGKSAKGAVFYTNSFRFDKEVNVPKVINRFDQGLNSITDRAKRSFFGSPYPSNVRLYNNLGNLLQTGMTQSHNLGVEGGNDRLTYRFSSNYIYGNGIVPGADFKKINIGGAGTVKTGRLFELSSTFNYANTKTNKNFRQAGNALLESLLWPQNDDMRIFLNPDGSRRILNPTPASANNPFLYYGEGDDPYFSIAKNKNCSNTNRVYGSVAITLNPFPWLSLTNRTGADVYSDVGAILFHPESSLGNAYKTNGSLQTYTDNFRLLNNVFLATLKKSMNKFNSSLLLGSSVEDTRDEVNSFSGQQFYLSSFNSINNTDPLTRNASYSVTGRRLVSVFADLKLDYNRIFYLDLTGRQDRSSTLPVKNNTFFYPSASLSFIFSELGTWKHSPVLSMGKLRASFAQVGKDAPPYSTLSTFQSVSTLGGGFTYSVTGGNPTLKPEKTNSYEIGTELQFFNGRIGLEADYYSVESKDQIAQPRVSYATGSILKTINGGFIRNHGIEAIVSAWYVKTPSFTWNGQFNFGLNRNKAITLPGGLSEYYAINGAAIGGVRTSVFPGGTTTGISGLSYQRNAAGNVLVDPLTGYPLKNAFYKTIGDRNPNFSLGFINRFSYRGWSLSVLVDTRRGGDVYNGNELFLYQNGLSVKTLNRDAPIVVKGVLKDGLENTLKPTVNTIQVTPGLRSDYYINRYVEEDFVEHNINWIRLQDVTLSYKLPQSLLNKQGLFESVSVFITGTNLFLITNYTGADPNTNTTGPLAGGIAGAGFDFGTFSVPRSVAFGISVRL